MECCGDDQATHSQRKKTSGCLCNDRVEMLLQTVETTKKEAHSHDQEQVRQHTSNKRGLDNYDFVFDQGDNGHN